MDVISLFFAVILVVSVFILGLDYLSKTPFKDVARKFHLEGEFPSVGPPKELRGRVGPYPVWIMSVGESTTKQLNVGLRLQHDLAQSLQVKTAMWLQRFNQDDLEVEDGNFDKQFLLEGADLHLLAYLNSRRRTLLTKWKKRGLFMEDGYLIFASNHNMVTTYRLTKTLNELLDLARNLDEDELDLYEALAANARSDPHLPFRRRCLRALLREAEPHPLVTQVAREHLESPDLEVRAWAAGALGEEGIPALFSVISHGENEQQAAITAIKILATLKHEDAEKALVHGLVIPIEAVRIATLKELIAKQTNFNWASWTNTEWRNQIPRRLLELREIREPASASKELLPLVCEALGLFCDDNLKDDIIERLSHIARESMESSSIASDAVLQCVVHLQRLGGREEIELLMELSKDGQRPTRQAALKAVRKIQTRLGLSQGDGHLSLTKTQGGEVSIASDKGGLSLSEKEVCDVIVDEV